ncbi:beta-glucuronidase [Pedobacter sp. ISL-68]|uniref:glycoside hydrolase family 2 protein n=1 Tax=unclassified Pedobacter TaxID=2628915 RepID=UPI001BE8D76C|nr:MULTISPECIES: glycoside hydrolase family 2 TIM barrel-domain containing protein [unclassified Pedobacter]MBT2561585.1 beta-glucuronidase [Pedobacter sp. ISL-64]MBT2590974.1 beta-glucuronidase [Pedobacter sp. ISL-68]
MLKTTYSVFLICFSLLSSISYGQVTAIQNIQGRKIQSLNGKWNYIVDPYENGYYDYRHDPFDQSKTGTGGYFDDKIQKDKSELIEYDFDHSPQMNVPGDWNSQSEKLELYEGNVWLRKKFDAKPEKGKKYFVYFGAVNYEAHVYLNGKKLGVHKGGFTPFQFDVTSNLKVGENSIVLKVDNIRKQDEIPTVNTDWWNYGGITRDVYLAEFPEHFISDYKLQLVKGSNNLLNFSVKLADATAGQEITLSIPELKLEKKYKTDGEGKIVDEFLWNNLSLWSPETPKLYTVNIKTDKENIDDKIGFRTIQVDGDSILLNGKSIFLRGISLHDENPLLAGRLRSEGDMRMMLQWAKEMNCNYVRLAHYPHNEEMIRLADEMGLLVWAEVPVYWTISWTNPATYANAKKQLTDLIVRDKNRASVIVWSIGNETPLSDARLSFMSNLAETARSLDDTRLVAAALEVHREGNNIILNDPLGEKIDLVSFNEYAGWYWGGNPSEITKYNFDIKYKKPVVITEFGGDALGGFHADENTRWSEEYQEALYKNQIAMLSKVGALRGMTPWILTDFRSPRRQHPIYQNFWNRKGLISETGKKKKAFFVLKDFYDQMQVKYK